MKPGEGGAEGALAPDFGPAPVRIALLLLALGYFALLIADHVRAAGLRAAVPGPILFFAQIADLFPGASEGVIEYRAEGWLCGERRFVELDMAKLFPMLAGNKENRFYRLMHFYRRNRTALSALEDYCVRRYPPVPVDGGFDRIGGARFSSLVLPLPKTPGEVARYVRKPMSAYPDLPRTVWYHTPKSLAARRCGDRVGPGPEDAGGAPGGETPREEAPAP